MNIVSIFFYEHQEVNNISSILLGAQGGGHAGGEDGWQAVPSRPARGTFEKVIRLFYFDARGFLTLCFSRWTRQESNLSQRARLTPTVCPLVLQKLEVPAGAGEVRPRAPAERR